jgi:thiol-disulfide isomerase/thioredoxin
VIRTAAGLAVAALLVSGCAASGVAKPTVLIPAVSDTVGTTVFAAGSRPALPTLSGATLGGGTLDLASLRGHVVVLNVWASWCEPCKAESPALVAVARRTATQGVRFVGIDENDEDAAASAFLAKIGSSYPHLVDPQGRLLASLRMLPPAVPSSLVIDPQGRVAARVIGPTTEAGMLALLARVQPSS